MKFEIKQSYSTTLERIVYWAMVNGMSEKLCDTVQEAEEYLDNYTPPSEPKIWEYTPKSKQPINNVEALCKAAEHVNKEAMRLKLHIAGGNHGN